MQLFPRTSYEFTCIPARGNLWIQVQLPSLTELDLASNNISQAHLPALHPSALQDLCTQRIPFSESHGQGGPPSRCLWRGLAPGRSSSPGVSRFIPKGSAGPWGHTSAWSAKVVRGNQLTSLGWRWYAVVNFPRLFLALLDASLAFTIAQPHILGRFAESTACTGVTDPA